MTAPGLLAKVNARAAEERERRRIDEGYYLRAAHADDSPEDDEEDDELDAIEEEPPSERAPLRQPARPSAGPRLMTPAQAAALAAEPLEVVPDRPRTRADCKDGERPCPFVSCRYHLYLEVSRKTGAIKLSWPDLEVEELGESCALDVADRGAHSLDEIGDVMNVTHEGARLVEAQALLRLKRGVGAGDDE